MQGLVVVGLIVEKISNFDIKCVKVTEARNIGQGHDQDTCKVCTLRSTIQGLVVVGLIVQEKSNLDVK